jgi:hypothetical protein
VTPPASGCGFVNPAFCETFSTSTPNANPRAGDLPVYWGASRTNFQVNTNEGWTASNAVGCASDGATAPDLRICNGQLRESIADNGTVANLSVYPKQPFDFAGRTGVIAFDVSNDSQGTHGAWPELWVSDKPNPTPFVFEAQPGPAPQNGFGIRFDTCGNGTCGVEASVVRGTVVADTFDGSLPIVNDQTVIQSNGLGQMNHYEVRVSQGQIDVYGSDAFTPGAAVPALKHIATVPNANLSLSRGLVWLEDTHYNANKFGTQGTHTFAWDNLGFDGPKTYRDLSFDVPDATPNTNGPLGYRMPVTLSVSGVQAVQTPTGAAVALNWYTWDSITVPTISINGNAPITTPWPYTNTSGFTERSLVVPVPLSQVHLGGTNTITLTGPASQVVHNVNLVLVAGAPVP